MIRKQTGSETTSFAPVPGSARELLPNSRGAGSIDGSEIASITVRTRAATDIAILEREVEELYTKRVTDREYLTREDLATRHGALSEDLDAIEQYAQTHNLIVSRRSTAERTLVLTGRLGDLLNAFHADVHEYHHSTGAYRGRQGEIQVPVRFKDMITGIFGFDTRPKHKAPHRTRAMAATMPGTTHGVPATEFAKRYNFPTEYQGATLDGAGQCIAIIELGGGFNHTDLQVYFHDIGVPLPNVTAISVDNVGNRPTKRGAADGEVMLDIEVVGAVAPKAAIAVYFAPNQGSGFLDAVNAAVHDSERRPGVISISWGGPEEQAEQQSTRAFHEVFVEAAALGITVCAASGDHGTADLDGATWDGKLHVDHPAVDDLVLACGGTQIDVDGHDVVWNDNTPFSNAAGGGGWATGGGISETVRLPGYQRSAKVPVSIDTGKPGRGVPDIAMSATNYFARVQGFEGVSGGTSAVAPLMGGLVLLLNQAKKKNVGFLNPFLYANASKGVVKDVIKGTNAITDTVKGYDAHQGWDACTGLGTPDGTLILNNV